MSHSAALVIGEDPEALLAPYDEAFEVEPYRRYEDVSRPADHWLFDKLVEEGMPADVGWPGFLELYNARYEGADPHLYDAEMDRIYETSTYNPKSRWDWYLLGGRWTGYFALKAGRTGEVGEPGLMTSSAPAGRVDQARKDDIDFDAMRAAHEKDARDEISRALSVLAGAVPLMPWAAYHDVYSTDIDKARQAYHAQPALAALREARLDPIECPFDFYCLGSVDPETVYVTRAVALRTTPFAICTADGWAEKGRMGWFGVVHDEADDWPERAWKIIDSAADDALFSLYDLHI